MTDEEDPVMRSMRSVWISMRDEEPPTSGLAELLAAARTKADEMKPKPVPWWQRMFAVMLRPPMLAAATVVVLVGGAVVVSQRTSGEVERAAVVTPPEDLPAPERSKEPSRDVAQDKQAVSIAEPPPETAVAKPPVAPPPKRPPPRGEPHTVESVGGLAPTHDLPPPPPPPPPPSGHAEDKLEIATENDEGGQQRAPEPDVTTKPNSIQPRAGQGTGQPPVEQLVKQAEVAAGRKDCPAVRVTVKRIQQLDKTARDRVAKQPAVANCLK